MEDGSIEFDITLLTLKKWGTNNLATIVFPTYYQPRLGN